MQGSETQISGVGNKTILSFWCLVSLTSPWHKTATVQTAILDSALGIGGRVVEVPIGVSFCLALWGAVDWLLAVFLEMSIQLIDVFRIGSLLGTTGGSLRRCLLDTGVCFLERSVGDSGLQGI